MEKNYLQWLSEETPTKWWHDSAIPEEINAAAKNGALGVTTNPVLCYKTLQANPERWDTLIKKIPESIKNEDRAEAILKIITSHAAEIVRPFYYQTGGRHGYAFGQLNPAIAGDADAMYKEAKRILEWAPNIAIKLPTTQAGLELVEQLASEGNPVCATINLSVSQAIAVAESYRKGLKKAAKSGKKGAPCFAVQQIGRIDDYLRDVAKDMRAGLDEPVITQAGLAIAKRSWSIFQEMHYEAIIMPAGLRGVYHITELAGGDVIFSLHPRIQKMILEANLKKEERINIAIDKKVIESLLKIPEFARAYEPDGLKPGEFITFGASQKILSQFLETGWAPLEIYGSNTPSSRWT